MMTMRRLGDHVRARRHCRRARHTDDVPLRSPAVARGARGRRGRGAPRGRQRRADRRALGAQPGVRRDGVQQLRAAGRRGRGARGRGGTRPAQRAVPVAARGHVRLVRPREHPPRAPGVPAGVRGVPLAQPRGVPQPRGRGVHRGRGQTHGGGDRGTRLRASANETRIGHGFHGLFARAFSRRSRPRGRVRASRRRLGSVAIGRDPASRSRTERGPLGNNARRSFSIARFFFRDCAGIPSFLEGTVFFSFFVLERHRARAFDDDETDIEPNT